MVKSIEILKKIYAKLLGFIAEFWIKNKQPSISWVVLSYTWRGRYENDQRFFTLNSIVLFIISSNLFCKLPVFSKNYEANLGGSLPIRFWFPYIVILKVHEHSALNCMFNNFFKHPRVFDHQIANLRVQSIICVRICQDEDEPANYWH